jgi:hypothetical protein
MYYDLLWFISFSTEYGLNHELHILSIINDNIGKFKINNIFFSDITAAKNIDNDIKQPFIFFYVPR